MSILVIVGSILFEHSNGLIAKIQRGNEKVKVYSTEYKNGSGTNDNVLEAFPGFLFTTFVFIAGTMKLLKMGPHRLKIEVALYVLFCAISIGLMYCLVLETSSPFRTLVEDKNIGMIIMTSGIVVGLISIPISKSMTLPGDKDEMA
jgi:hypothetical protein